MEKEKMIKEMANFSFSVIDNKTGKEADDYTIALKEDWAKGLIYCDMEGFAIKEDGHLVLLDECGNFAYCPSERFSIIPEGAVVVPKEISYYENIEKALRTVRLGEKSVDFTNEQIMALTTIFHHEELREKEQIRKETARKVLDKVDNESNGQTKQITNLLRKQFGVEIKE